MLRRSERLKKMSENDNKQNEASSASESDNEKTMIEQDSVDELKEEIRQMKIAMKSLMEKANSTAEVNAQQQHVESISSQLASPTITIASSYALPTNTNTHYFPPTAAPPTASNYSLLPNMPYSTMPSHQPMQQKLSMNQFSVPHSFYPSLDTLYYSATNMPHMDTSAFVPPSPYSAAFAHHSSSAYMPPLPTQPVSLTSTAHTTATTSVFSPNISAAQFMPRTQHVNEHRSLRKLQDLPEFNGQPEQWPMFSVSYKESTQCYGYTKLENLNRLQKALKGDAKNKVEAHLIHPESVDQVMKTLEFHYGRPQIMIRSQLAKVRAFPSISGNKLSEIVNFSTMVSNLTAFLENAGANPHLNNPTLLDELVNKLPLAKREEWMKYSFNEIGNYPSIREFSIWLQEVATYISMALETDSIKCETQQIHKPKVKPSFAINTIERRQPNCVMCHQNHYLNQCTKFKNISTPDRWKFVKDNRLCFTCLHIGHNTYNCKNRRQCGLSKCEKYHNRLLHENDNSNKNLNAEISEQSAVHNRENKQMESNREDNNTSVTTIIDSSLNKKSLFKFLPVELKGRKGCVKVIAFIDDGSKISLLEDRIAKQIGLNGPISNLSLGWVGGITSNEMSMKVNVEISSLNENTCHFSMKNVRTTENLKLPSQSLYLERFKEKFPVLDNIKIHDYSDVIPKILIGLPHLRLVRPNAVINLDGDFCVHQTNLGNILFGSNEENSDATVCVIDIHILDDIQQQISEYFTIENFGMKVLNPVVSEDDKKAQEILQKTTVKIGNKYETGLLWRKDNFEFIHTFSAALKRLQNVELKMERDTDFADWYKDKINEYVLKSYARKLSPYDASIENNNTWYLPHFVVSNLNKGNKRRLVFDAAANVDGESFNSRLMKGPSQYQPKPLLSILFKFRQCQIGVCADIREMFHRVKIREQDQHAQRFLWRDGDRTKPPDIYVMQAMIFGSASSPCSAQYVKNLNAKLYEESHPRAYRAIVECHYVDDYVDSFDTLEEAVSVTKSVKSIHEQAGFELRGFISNSAKFCNAIDKEESSWNNLTNLCRSETHTEKILGLFWSPVDDTFCFVLKFARVPHEVLSGFRRPTKREVLGLTMSIFDPFGFLANIVISSKMLLQELWRYNIDWNSPIPEEIYKRWFEWYKQLENVKSIRIPRCYNKGFCSSSSKIELHVFVDASELAFAAVGYWRICHEGSTEIVFIAGKAKCAPIKALSVPRLELQAALLGVRLKDAIISSHDILPKRVIFWSDSKTVIKWIYSESRIYKQFVSHRIAEILDSSKMNQWRWVPGSQNPADDATRPQYFSKNSSSSRWLDGPDFLKSEEDNWPQIPEDKGKDEWKCEMRSKFLFTISPIVSCIKYDEKSKYYKLLRITCWVFRAVKIFKCFKSNKHKSTLNLKGYLTAKEIKNAEIYWCKVAQKEEYSEEYEMLSAGIPLKRKSHIFNLTPILGSDGLMRLSGRINNAKCVPYETRQPIIMPKGHILTKLIVKQYHEDFKHQNQESICAALRLKFWIPCVRQLVRSAKNNCQLCKNLRAAPQPPLMGQLPVDRVTPYVRPFTYTGLDYLGPFTVSIGRRCEKRWVALFTCLTVRAIHLEIAKDLSTDAAILCIRNFINRRGLPERIRSDRGTNFIGASKEEFVINEASLADECARRGIEWVFNAPANPSAGGAWERMVRSVKSVLAFTLKERSPQVETLNSLLIEAENLVNSRPLTHLGIECSDSEPLTPNHFLLGCPNIVQTPAVGGKVILKKQWHILQQLKQMFWKRWVLEYLPDLTRRTKWYSPVEPIKKGDVVIICDDNESRGEWKKGIVEEVFTAADGQVRSAVVKTSIGKLRRPASKLAILDVSGESPRSTHGWRDVVN